MKYNRELHDGDPQRSLPDRQGVNATVIPLDDAPQGYKTSTRVQPEVRPDPNGLIPKA